MDHKKYKSIKNFENNLQSCVEVGHKIVIQEKIDGANASFQYNDSTDVIECFSRRKILDENNTLQGLYEWCKFYLNKENVSKYPKYRFFGEWLVKHAVKYPDDKYKRFYLFDIYDVVKDQYLPHNEVVCIGDELGLDKVPTFFVGEFKDWDQVIEYVGKTEMGAEFGEGIVLKNMSTLYDEENSQKQKYIKFVNKDFHEKKKIKHKELDVVKLKEAQIARELVATIVTKARVRKKLFELVEDDIIPPDYCFDNMPVIARNLPRLVYNDCLKEEESIVRQVTDFGRYCGKQTMELAREILREY